LQQLNRANYFYYNRILYLSQVFERDFLPFIYLSSIFTAASFSSVTTKKRVCPLFLPISPFRFEKNSKMLNYFTFFITLFTINIFQFLLIRQKIAKIF